MPTNNSYASHRNEEDIDGIEPTTTLLKIDPPSDQHSSSSLPSLPSPSSVGLLKTHMHVLSATGVNIVTSIGIIFLNKYIFSHYQIKAVTLTAIHMVFTSIGLFICLQMKTFVRKTVPLVKVLPLSIAFCGFVVFTNLSLEYNTVGTYQLFKVLTTPIVALITWQYYKTKYSRLVILTLVPVVAGVCGHSVYDVQLTIVGTTMAGIGVISASLYQVWIGERLKDLDMDSQQLLFYQAPLSTLILLPFILLMEGAPSYTTNEQQRRAIFAVVVSGVFAFGINLTIYWVIKNTSALTYNMVGHMKTVAILFGGFLLFQDKLNSKQFVGILFTLFGIFSYTFVRMREQNQLPWPRWNLDPTAHTVKE